MDDKVAATLDQVLEFVSSAVTENEILQNKVAELQGKLASQEKVVLEKVAASTFNDNALNAALLRLVELQVINGQQMQKISQEIKDKPDRVFDLLTKVSEVLIGAPTEGAGIAKEASSNDDNDPEDPDGWKAMAKGKEVKIKRG